ncbi:molybdenum cofactor biosynthesis protein MoaE [Gordonia pseudamarae]|uniref:Molybdenum cofactor biosynthesis protein MoaE n=1 Tax=Gordonia pseudamarae TaxID=2831662 RepID=A0ABX6IET9_9ACTN|nr:molybdenum cofactor biosynthesis protein MoaE [Gordonia sp. (in: high G+C Gram-positive bacteria)]QHN25440.1 molybdenum cofactor biosynthesis protein MoaE [Gordonia pseudamarae]QHN34372.1 molybdenum cofactor biosynthesis protein MoaE [Gordonia pseudamarae]
MIPIRTAVCEDPICQREHEDHVTALSGGAAGAIVGFGGIVRHHDGDHDDVVALSYSAHPSAPGVLDRVVAEVTAGAGDGVRAVAVSHRVGDLGVGDVAFVVAVAADHRGEAFTLCAGLVDEVKARLPVWKHQRFADGTDEWVGSA